MEGFVRIVKNAIIHIAHSASNSVILKEDSMFGIGLPELTILLVIVLIVFGAGKLPAIGAGIGKSIRNFKNAVTESDKSSEKQESQ